MNKEEVESLVSLLSETNDSLSTIRSKFVDAFRFRNRMTAITTLSMLLSDGLLDHSQQIVALWITLKEFPEVSINDHPLLPIFVYLFNQRLTNPNMCPPQMYDILGLVLEKKDYEYVGSMSVKTIFSSKFSVDNKPSSNIPDVKPYQHKVPLVLSESKQYPQVQPQDQKQILMDLLLSNSLLDDFEPLPIRPVPDLLPISSDELSHTFISSFDSSPFLFDECVSINSKTAALSMINRSTESKLKPAESDSLILEFKKSPELISEANLPYDRIESMIELNPSVAKEVVEYLAIKKDPKILDFLSKTPITNSIAEVIGFVLERPDLPSEQLEQFVRNSITTLQSMSNQQNYTKRISLFCGMLCEICKKGIRFSDTMLVDLYSFCVEPKNDSIKESQELANILSY
ncbi:CCR4-NOT transcription complex subunit 11 [Histomonas meleagridis]|uniref:CCR4-NOT transcription complex subunit 11 n=1 Tax=Histomonas meleagridis TaxID=135588 RepID=UPI00355A1B62|nr:CCR4-NOT transcription complex subunit 11 [Histomonas meleagridis]KAH0802847.1 CCR4-NOT transcription complex subunit 11 [Histomonas meleagridis]